MNKEGSGLFYSKLIKSSTMKKIMYPIFILIVFMTMSLHAQISFHDFTVMNILGEEFDLAQFKGKKVLVVNTASKCGLSPQYAGLEKLYRDYGGGDFVVIGFPSNDFAKQEPGTNEEIATFCSTKYEVSFPMMSKIVVKGDDKHPLYKWLTEAAENGVEDSRVSWNFQKYLIDENGTLIGHIAPRKKPECKEIISWIIG